MKVAKLREDLRQKTVEELKKELENSLRDQFVFRMQRAAGQLKKPSEMKKTRLQIARIKTILNEMKSAGNK